jgi:outer membrane receptor protein involved in Fe transport
MSRTAILKSILAGTAATLMASAANAENFNIPAGDLAAALDAYSAQTGISLMVSSDAVRGLKTRGAKGDLTANDALSRILSGTGFATRRYSTDSVAIIRNGEQQSEVIVNTPMQLAQAAPARTVETVTVTSSKLGGADVQSIPIAITALSQEQLTATQTAGGPDLVKQVPNLTFTKTNFSGYSIQIRGIGTQAVSVTTDPAVAVALNDMPFIRNHFFEQEFFDLGQLEVLRGPQGTLYGRNATAGVVNLTTAKPTDQFEAMASAELGNYHQKRFEGMLNLPIVDDRLDLRLAGEWTKRQGYSFNSLTDQRIDGRDLWSGRVTLGFKPMENLQTYLVWERFQEDDDRMRSSKQTCKRAPDAATLFPVNSGTGLSDLKSFLNQGCVPASFYSPEAFQVVNGNSLTYYGLTGIIGNSVNMDIDPYGNAINSPNLRVIESARDPAYKVKSDIIQLETEYRIDPSLTFVSQTGFGSDYLWATEDYNRFNTQPGVFVYEEPTPSSRNRFNQISPEGVFCDPQLGCSDRLVAQDLVKANSWQLNQEFRLSSSFSGPFNFSVGGNYMHYETHENYYVFINSLSLFTIILPAWDVSPGPYTPGVSDNFGCLPNGGQPGNPNVGSRIFSCIYMDPNPIDKLNDQGHNYFLSQNPYTLNSYATFGEAYYSVTDDLKLTGGVRWTHDSKHFPLVPSWLMVSESYGYPVAGVVNQNWSEVTGRFVANWTPKLDFTDQTLFYASFSRGYKAGGANPPLPVGVGGNNTGAGAFQSAVHPLTFDPEFINAFELGTKNTLLDGTLTVNGSAFYYDYKGYQISEIVDRTSVNHNYDAHIKGAEIEATWEPVPGLRFNFGGGYEDARFAKGSQAIDLIDRTAGNPDYFVVKPFPTAPTNCIVPTWVVKAYGAAPPGWSGWELCNQYRSSNTTRIGQTPPGSPTWYVDDVPNHGEGLFKDISNNMMPNAPPFTASLGAQYSMPITSDWAATFRADGYWQDNSYWRVFNDLEYDKLHGYASLNLSIILTSQAGWQVMLFDKNVLNTTAITGAFLNSDDSGLTTNVFLTDPKLIGIRVTKNW